MLLVPLVNVVMHGVKMNFRLERGHLNTQGGRQVAQVVVLRSLLPSNLMIARIDVAIDGEECNVATSMARSQTSPSPSLVVVHRTRGGSSTRGRIMMRSIRRGSSEEDPCLADPIGALFK
jgi:hypothetical protein